MMPSWFRRLPLPTSLKHLAGSAWMMSGRLFAMGSIASFGLAVFAGALSAIDSVFISRNAWYEEGKLADLELRVVADDIYNFPDFHGIPGVANFRARMIYPGSLTLAQRGEETLRILLISAATESAASINTQTIISGKALSSDDRDGVVIERSLSRFSGVKVGDVLPVKLGNDHATLHVRGIVSDPEFLLTPANPSLFVPSKASLGVIYTNHKVLSERFGFTPANSVLFRALPGTDIEAMRQAVIERAQSRLNVDYTATRTEQFSYQFLEKDLGVFRIVVPVIVMVSVLSAVFVTVFLFMQWVAQERQALAVFLTLGHTPYKLSSSFAVMFIYLTSGVVFGGMVFAVLVGRSFLYNFSASIGLPLPHFALTPTYVGCGIVGVITIFALAGSVVINRIFSLSPRDAMRHGIVLTHAPDRIGSALGRLLPRSWLRMPLRSLFRHRIVSGVSIIAVALGFGITASFFIAFSSFVGTSVNRVNQNKWDIAVDFVAPMWDENVAELVKANQLTDYAPYTKGVVQSIHQGRRVNLYVGGFDPDKHWQSMLLVAGEGLSPSVPNGILLEQSTARELGVGVGSELTVEVQGRQRTAFIRGLFSGAMPGEARFPISFHQDLADIDSRTTGLLVRTTVDIPTLSKRLLQNPDVQQVLTKAQVAREILAASGQVTEIIKLGSLISITIAALFVFACVGYTVLQRRGEYQMLRVLGYRDGFITTIILVEIAFLGIASLVLAIPIGALTGRYLNYKLSQAWFQVDTIISLADYLKTFIPGFILLPLIALPVSRMVLKVPLESELRSREIS